MLNISHDELISWETGHKVREPIMELVGTTKSLNIFRTGCRPNALMSVHELFVAYLKDADQPAPIAFCAVWSGMSFVDWLWTHELYRRRGYATELVEFVDALFDNKLNIEGATPEGEAFEDSYLRKHDDANSNGSADLNGGAADSTT